MTGSNENIKVGSLYVIPFTPPNVDPKDLQPNGMLLDVGSIDRLRGVFNSALNPSGAPLQCRYTRKSAGAEYPIININGAMYAVYKGKKHGKALGSGTFGTTKLIQDVEGVWHVLKVMKHNQEHEFTTEQQVAIKETENLRRFHEPRSSIAHYSRQDKHGNDQNEIVMPLAKGSTVEAIAKKRKMPTINWLKMSEALLVGIQGLHKKGLYHRDIKRANMLYDPVTNEATPIDLGFARSIAKCINVYPCGSPRYMAPEIRKVHEHNKKNPDDKQRCTFTEATEVYALGVTLAEIFIVQIDETDETDPSIAGSLEADNKRSDFHTETKKFKAIIDDPNTRKEIMSLISAALDDTPEKRPTLEAAIKKLQEIQEGYKNSHLHVMSQINKMAYVDVAELAELIGGEEGTKGAKFQELIKALRATHVVQLVCEKFDSDQARQVRHVLQRQGILVMERAYQFHDINKKSEELSAYTRVLGNENSMIYHPFYLKTDQGKSILPVQETTSSGNTVTVIEMTVSITHSKTKNDYSNMMKESLASLMVTDELLKNVKSSINEQCKQLQLRDPSDSRISTLSSFAETLGTSINYRDLLDKLTIVEKAVMGQSKGWSKVSEMLGHRATSTTKLVHAIRSDIESNLSLRR